MRRADLARLLLLAAIWGASFLFIRIAAPALGPVLTAELRTLIGGVALAAWFAFTGFDPEWRRWGRQYVIVGIVSSALPFLLWAYAALRVTAGLLSVLNATSPMWGALCSALLLRRAAARAADRRPRHRRRRGRPRDAAGDRGRDAPLPVDRRGARSPRFATA